MPGSSENSIMNAIQKNLETRKRNSVRKASDERVVYDVPEAGAKLGLSRNGSYEAARRGEIPTVKFGRLLKVPKVAFDRMLEQRGTRETA
jgi:excisionase family DNA binding protein